MGIPKELYPLIGTVSAALIAGIASFITLVLSKENKVSDLRQAWIDALREDISEYCGLIYQLYPNIRLVNSTDRNPGDKLPTIDELIHSQFPEWGRLNRTISRIVLRLNRKEHEQMIKLITYSYTQESIDSLLSTEGLQDQRISVLKEADKILKSEWTRVKRGEPLFVATKNVAVGITVGAASVLLAFVCKGLWILIVS